MTKDEQPLRDEEIIAQEQRNDLKRIWVGIVSGLAFGLVLVLGIITQWDRLSPAINTPGWRGTVVLSALLITPPIVGWAGFSLFMRWRFPITKEARSERIIHKRIDEYQSQRRRSAMIMLLVFFWIAYHTAVQPPQLGPNATSSWLSASFFPLMTILLAVVACFGRGLIRTKFGDAANDELSRSLRARATQYSYFTIMVALCAIYPVILYQPSWITFALPSIMFIGVAVPVILFTIFELRASRQ